MLEPANAMILVKLVNIPNLMILQYVQNVSIAIFIFKTVDALINALNSSIKIKQQIINIAMINVPLIYTLSLHLALR